MFSNIPPFPAFENKDPFHEKFEVIISTDLSFKCLPKN